MRKNIILVGDRFGLWTVISLESVRRWHAVCTCQCGTIREVMKSALNNGASKGCGCVRKEGLVRMTTKHGKHKDKSHVAWSNMKARCSNPNHPSYPHYGGRGITVCKEWEDYLAFLADMGEPPAKGTLERKDTNLGYDKSNCVWVSQKKNSQNTRKCKRWHINGATFNSISEAAKALGKCESAISSMCNGRTDKGRFYPPKENCWSELVYE